MWEAGKSDPLTVHYDVGLGRLFRPEELEPAIKDERHSLGRRHQIKARALPPAMTDEEAENVVNLARSA